MTGVGLVKVFETGDELLEIGEHWLVTASDLVMEVLEVRVAPVEERGGFGAETEERGKFAVVGDEFDEGKA